MSDLPVIFNPSARSEKGQKWVDQIRGFSSDIELVESHSFEEARRLAEEAVQAGARAVIAAGGDGTVNAVIAGLAGLETPLGVFPTGTMNLFARELGLPMGDLERCWKVIETGLTKKVDIFEAGDGIFVQIAGVGFDAQIIEETSWESKKKFGVLSYLMSAFSVAGKEPPRLRVIPANEEPVEGAFVLIGNGSLYGPAFKVFRNAANDDGMLEVLVFGKQSHVDIFRYLSGITIGQVEKMKDVTYLRTPHLRVESDDPVPVEVDGELSGTTPVEFRPTAKQLRVLAPIEAPVEDFAQ